jgi:multicomponent Na+:H+ antiporter subunit G
VRDLVTALLVFSGGLLMLVAAVGVFRMPDLFSRMQAAAKAATLGAACILLGLAVYFGELGVTSRALLVICFLFLTAPVAAHRLARAAYFTGVALWHGTVRDELAERRMNAAEK